MMLTNKQTIYTHFARAYFHRNECKQLTHTLQQTTNEDTHTNTKKNHNTQANWGRYTHVRRVSPVHEDED